MNQMDLFDKTHDFYFFDQLQKVKTSMDKRTRALFSLMSELQNEILNLKEKNEHL